ncbi:hypothetical protein V8C37DRAFT_377373 [Trichoderma ceciliae]
MSGRIINLEAYDDPDPRPSRSQGGSEGGRALRAQLINRGIDRDVLAVLDTSLYIGRQSFTIFDTLGNDDFRSSSRSPGYSVVETNSRTRPSYSGDRVRQPGHTFEVALALHAETRQGMKGLEELYRIL